MRIILLVLFVAFVGYANPYEWIDIYRNGGVKALEKKIDETLKTKEYWQEILKQKDTRFGYYENLKYLFLATKEIPILKLYEFENNKWQEKFKANSLVGSKKGDKLKEGDLATPIGVYTLNSRLTNLDQYYGPLALTTSYPNLYDRLQMRTGYGIWIHGMPLDGNRENLNTRGCIAIENDLLIDVDKMIDYKKSLLITFENQIKEASKEDLATILADLFSWRESWINNDVEAYLSFYDKEFIRYDRQKYKEFAETKRRIFKKNESKKIEFSQINISPYPNDEDRNLFRISYHQDYKAYLGSRLNYSSNGAKELYIELKNGKMQILAEQ